MGKRVKAVLANLTAQAASGDATAVANLDAALASHAVARARKGTGFFQRAFGVLQNAESHLPSLARKLAPQGANPARSYAQFLSEQQGAKTFTQRREALRRHHERETTPFSHTANVSRKADAWIASDNPDTRAAGMQMRAKVNAATLKRGVIGLAVAGTALTVAGSAAAAGALKVAANKAAVSGAQSVASEYNAGNNLDWNSIPESDGQATSVPGNNSPASTIGIFLIGVIILVKLLI